MDQRTFLALQGSIAKWTKVASGTYEEHGGHDCPLCALFADEIDPNALDDEGEDGCHGCPVKAHTGKHGCVGTPYVNRWVRARNDTPLGFPRSAANTPAKLAAARAELEFLKSLLPPGTAPDAQG